MNENDQDKIPTEHNIPKLAWTWLSFLTVCFLTVLVNTKDTLKQNESFFENAVGIAITSLVAASLVTFLMMKRVVTNRMKLELPVSPVLKLYLGSGSLSVLAWSSTTLLIVLVYQAIFWLPGLGIKFF